jgi:ribokinase
VVGSLNADLVVRAARAPERGETVPGIGFHRHPGGKGGNQACAAARLAAGQVHVAMIGRVGGDSDGQWLRRSLEDDGVDVTAVAVDQGLPTGLAAITVEGSGDNRIVVVPGANQALTPGALSRHHDTLAAADVLLLQLEIPMPTVQTAIRMGREKRATIILDPAPARPLPDGLLALVDYLTPNESELAALAGPGDVLAAAGRLLARGVRQVVVKLGERGALLVGPDGAQEIAPFPVTAVDTTAAGDAWNAAFGVALALGRQPAVAARFANAAGALAVTRPGAQPSLPRRASVDALFGQQTVTETDPTGREPP